MDNPEPVNLLRLHRSTRGLDDEQIRLIAQHAEVIHAADGQVIQGPGEAADALLLVIAGHLSLALVLPSGNEKTVIFFGRDEQIGLLAIIQDEPIPSRVVAQQQSLLVRIPREAAISLKRELPLWGRNLLQSLAPTLRHSLLGEKSQKRPRFVVLIHTSEKTRHLTSLLTEQLTFLGESVIRRDGDAIHALLESINLPGIARPINRAGKALVGRADRFQERGKDCKARSRRRPAGPARAAPSAPRDGPEAVSALDELGRHEVRDLGFGNWKQFFTMTAGGVEGFRVHGE